MGSRAGRQLLGFIQTQGPDSALQDLSAAPNGEKGPALDRQETGFGRSHLWLEGTLWWQQGKRMVNSRFPIPL